MRFFRAFPRPEISRTASWIAWISLRLTLQYPALQDLLGGGVFMRYFVLLCAVLLGACAGQPAATVPASTSVAKASQTSATATPVGTDGKIDLEKLANAKKMGFTPVNKDGEVLYCRSDLKTGSRVERETVCMTLAEIDALREQTKQQMGDFARRAAPAPTR